MARRKLSRSGELTPSTLILSLNPSWLRLAYAVEFFVALIAIISLWSEIGGEGHLDLMPWYYQAGLYLGIGLVLRAFYCGMVEQPRSGRAVP